MEQWDLKPPQDSGYYWLKHAYSGEASASDNTDWSNNNNNKNVFGPEIVKINKCGDRLIFEDGRRPSFLTEYCKVNDCLWSGPIPTPVDYVNPDVNPDRLSWWKGE